MESLIVPGTEVSLIVAAIVSVAVGSVWYSPLLFGGVWTQALGMTLYEAEPSEKEILITTGKVLLVQVFFFFLLTHVISVVQKMEILLLYPITIFATLAVLLLASMCIWEKRSLFYFGVHGGYMFLSVLIGTGILVYWPW